METEVTKPAPQAPRVNLEAAPQKKALLNAIKHNNLLEFQRLLPFVDDLNFADSKGWTPLHIACDQGNLEMVIRLLKKGADLNFANMDNITSLRLACYSISTDRLAIVNVLLACSAKIEHCVWPREWRYNGLDVWTIRYKVLKALEEIPRATFLLDKSGPDEKKLTYLPLDVRRHILLIMIRLPFEKYASRNEMLNYLQVQREREQRQREQREQRQRKQREQREQRERAQQAQKHFQPWLQKKSIRAYWQQTGLEKSNEDHLQSGLKPNSDRWYPHDDL